MRRCSPLHPWAWHLLNSGSTEPRGLVAGATAWRDYRKDPDLIQALQATFDDRKAFTVRARPNRPRPPSVSSPAKPSAAGGGVAGGRGDGLHRHSCGPLADEHGEDGAFGLAELFAFPPFDQVASGGQRLVGPSACRLAVSLRRAAPVDQSGGTQ